MMILWKIITKDDVAEFVQAGADIILLPAPGTVPGITMAYIRELVICSFPRCINHYLYRNLSGRCRYCNYKTDCSYV